MKAVHVYVTGTVQGVYFRESTREQAQRFNVKGWVRNLPDGRVEAMFAGTEFAVDEMVAWCQTGPERAKVRHVDVRPADPRELALEGFEVRRG